MASSDFNGKLKAMCSSSEKCKTVTSVDHSDSESGEEVNKKMPVQMQWAMANFESVLAKSKRVLVNFKSTMANLKSPIANFKSPMSSFKPWVIKSMTKVLNKHRQLSSLRSSMTVADIGRVTPSSRRYGSDYEKNRQDQFTVDKWSEDLQDDRPYLEENGYVSSLSNKPGGYETTAVQPAEDYRKLGHGKQAKLTQIRTDAADHSFGDERRPQHGTGVKAERSSAAGFSPFQLKTAGDKKYLELLQRTREGDGVVEPPSTYKPLHDYQQGNWSNHFKSIKTHFENISSAGTTSIASSPKAFGRCASDGTIAKKAPKKVTSFKPVPQKAAAEPATTSISLYNSAVTTKHRPYVHRPAEDAEQQQWTQSSRGDNSWNESLKLILFDEDQDKGIENFEILFNETSCEWHFL